MTIAVRRFRYTFVMPPIIKRYLPVLLCALAIPLCAIIIRPNVEMGMNDDWAYIKTAQMFAHSGHFIYNGWASPMLGWQVLFAALLVRTFGFSFSVVRASVVLVSMATCVVIHRIFVRSGLTEVNATLSTVVLVFSPLFLPLAFSFMSDIPGFFGIAVCFYCCIRAVQTANFPACVAWLVAAAAVGVIGGTARQLAWLGALVMVPSAIWILRRNRRVVIIGALIYFVSISIIVAAMVWFKHQPHTLPEQLIPGPITLRRIRHLVTSLLRACLDIALLLLPVLAAFIVGWRPRSVRTWLLAALGVTLLLVPCMLHHPAYLAPFLGNYVSNHGVVDGTPILGERPIVLSAAVCVLLSIASAVGIVAFRQWLTAHPPGAAQPFEQGALSWYQLNWLTAPFALAYIALLLPRGTFSEILDRYLLSLLMLALVFLIRLYQERVSLRLPFIVVLTTALLAVYGIAATHDAFAMFRGRLMAISEMRTAGVPPEQIDAGFEYAGWTQIEATGYVLDTNVADPHDSIAAPQTPDDPCRIVVAFAPNIKPRYAVSYDPSVCPVATQFAPITYTEWLGQHVVTIYIVNVSPG